MTLKDFFGFGSAPSAAKPGMSGMTIKPMVVQAPNVQLPDSQIHELDLYRINAIVRHMDQSTNLTPQRMREFGGEMHERALRIFKAGLITEEQHDALLKPFKGV